MLVRSGGHYGNLSGETFNAVDDKAVFQVRLIPTTASVSAVGFQASIPSLHDARCRTPCNTWFRLAGSPLPDGSRPRWTAMQGFCPFVASFPLLPPCQSLVWHNKTNPAA